MVSLIRSKTYPTDPKDIWGKETTIGLAELAVRTNAPPMLFDRRGDVVFYDNFESPVKKFAADDGYTWRSTDVAYTGNYSLKANSRLGSGVGRGGPEYFIHNVHSDSRYGVQTLFSTSDDNWRIRIAINYYDTTNSNLFLLGLKSDGTLQYYDSTGNWQTITTDALYKQNIYMWAFIKVVGDLSTNKYVRAIVFNGEYDLSDYSCYVYPSTKPEPYMFFGMSIEEQEAATKTAYFDNIILTENEP